MTSKASAPPNAQKGPSVVGSILDGAASNQLVTVAAAFITGDGLIVDKNGMCVDVEDYRSSSTTDTMNGSSIQGSEVAGLGREAAMADALLTTQQARAAGVMMRTALRMHDPKVFIDHEAKRAASEDNCPMDRGVGVQIPFTQMNAVVLPSNENGFCLTGSDDLPYLLSILNDSAATAGEPTTGSPSSSRPSSSVSAPQITIHTNKRTIQCDALLLEGLRPTSTTAVNNGSGGAVAVTTTSTTSSSLSSQLNLPTCIQDVIAFAANCNRPKMGSSQEDNYDTGTAFNGDAAVGGDGTLSGADVTSTNNFGEELVRALHRNQKHALAFVVTASEC